MPKVLTKLRVDEVSCVTAGAGEGTRVVLYKRDDSDERSRRSFYHRLFAGVGKRGGDERRQRIQHLRRHIADGSGARPEEIGTDADTSADTDGNNTSSHIDRMADLIAEASQGAVTRDEALAWMLTNRHGRALLTHTNKHKDDNMTDDLVVLAKRIGDTGATHLSELEAFELIKKWTNLHRKEGESGERAFSRIYCGADDVGTSFRKMIQVAKGHPHPHVGARS